MTIEPPYLLFLGDAHDQLAAKTGQGIRDWRREWCMGQMRLPGCRADLGLPEPTLEEARAEGARTVVVGVANRGGIIPPGWVDVLEEAIHAGFDLAAGMHDRLADVPRLRAASETHGRRLFDVRHPKRTFDVGSGRKRPGKRVLTVGTDCSVGKMYTSLALEREMRRRGITADFRATGQTGILIAGGGVSVDAVPADYISGATEWLSPANDDDHWDLVEGQGSLFHPSFAGVSLGLLHGAQADALIMCHEPTRRHVRGLPDYSLPDLAICIERNLEAGQLTNPDVVCIGIAVNTSALAEDEARRYLDETAAAHGMPAVDPVRTGIEALVECLV